VTHPAFIAGIIDYFKDSGLEADRIVIAEKGGGFEESGFTAIAAKREVKIIDLDKDEIATIPLPQGRIFKEIGVAKSVKDGYLINVPKMKTHNLAITTLAMKNLQGVVTSKQRGFCGVEPWYRGREGELRPSGLTLHEEVFSNKICDLNLALRPNLNVIEGVVGREGTGFHRGTNIPTKFAVAGVDAVTVDAFTSYLMGFKPEEIGYLKIAAERGLGQIDISQMTVYEIREGTLSLCDDVESLVHKPPFKVIRGGW
ncbi:MAG: DUF362 domain-containing protein, partial [bacterium]